MLDQLNVSSEEITNSEIVKAFSETRRGQVLWHSTLRMGLMFLTDDQFICFRYPLVPAHRNCIAPMPVTNAEFSKFIDQCTKLFKCRERSCHASK